MNGPIAQAAALTCHANAALRGWRVTFSLENSTARFCERIAFVEHPGKERVAAAAPDEWFALLARENAGRVRLGHVPSGADDRQLAGFVGGGGAWLLRTATSTWIARWATGDQTRADRRIWRVDYLRCPPEPPQPAAGLDPIRRRLEAELERIRAFAAAHAPEWVTPFDRALRTLRTGDLAGYHRDLAPEGLLSAPAAALLDAAQSAWVFGAMGSWNDLGFDGVEQAEYERVSAGLFEAVTAAISAAASASAD